MSENQVIEKAALGALIREALCATPEAEPDNVVGAVLAAIDPGYYEHYLRQAIVSRISSEIGHLRAVATPEIRRGVSTKQSLIRDEYWPKFLQQRIYLPSGYKFLAEATAEDLRTIATQRRIQAQELMGRAEEFDTLADLMEKANVRYLEQLDAKAGAATLRRAA